MVLQRSTLKHRYEGELCRAVCACSWGMSALSRLSLLLYTVLVLTVATEIGVRLVLYVGKRLGFDVTIHLIT